jgi:hypothetical protein
MSGPDFAIMVEVEEEKCLVSSIPYRRFIPALLTLHAPPDQIGSVYLEEEVSMFRKITIFLAVFVMLLSWNTALGAVPGASALPQATLNVRALIDGRSQLIIRGALVSWHHLDFAAPGRHLFQDEPTYLNGISWFPTWPDIPDAENRDCNCSSSIYIGIPTLAAVPQTVELENIEVVLGVVNILQQPEADNDFTLVVEFNDNPAGGSRWYEIQLTYLTPIPASIDILPKVSPNVINLQKTREIKVAILATPDPRLKSLFVKGPGLKQWLGTITFGRTGEEASLALRGARGLAACNLQDVNKDKKADLVCRFETQKTGFQCGDAIGILRLTLPDKTMFEGRAPVQIEPCP